MRIIAGERKGALLVAPRGLATRPTLSRVRESLFSIIGPVIRDARVLDLYAGSGALGFEALSRGAVHCTFVDKSRGAFQALCDNAAKLRYGRDRALFETADVNRWCHTHAPEVSAARIVFADPPYGSPESLKLLEWLGTLSWAEPAPFVIIQTGRNEDFPQAAGSLRRFDERKYGETALWLYSLADAVEAMEG